MAPEQARGEAATPAADVFALGATLAFALTGEGPFGAGPPDTLMWRGAPGRIPSRPPPLPPAPRKRGTAPPHAPPPPRAPASAAPRGGAGGGGRAPPPPA